MNKIETREAALVALEANHIYEALRFLVTNNEPDTQAIIQQYLSSQDYTVRQATQLTIAITKYLESGLEERIRNKFTQMGINMLPLSLLIILTQNGGKREYNQLNWWQKGLETKLISVFVIDGDLAGGFYLSILTNVSISPLVTIGHALNYDESVTSVSIAKPDIVVIDHMMPRGYVELLGRMRALLPDSIFVFRTHQHQNVDMQKAAITAGADAVIPYGPYLPPERYVEVLLEAYKNKR